VPADNQARPVTAQPGSSVLGPAAYADPDVVDMCGLICPGTSPDNAALVVDVDPAADAVGGLSMHSVGAQGSREAAQ